MLLSEAEVRALCLYESVRLDVTCPSAPRHCYQVSLRGQLHLSFVSVKFICNSLGTRPEPSGNALGRSVRSAQPGVGFSFRSSRRGGLEERGGGAVTGPVVGVVVGVVSLLVLVVVLALCGGGADKYDPAKDKAASSRTR